MIANKHITKIVAVIMAAAVCLCLAAMLLAGTLTQALGGTGITMEYESKLFDTGDPMSVNIIMDEADWEDMLANATAEEYYQCDVEINGETFYRVGIRPKGNTSLTAIASDPTTDRYSFKLEFDQYVDGQTCYGLDKLVLNNNYADATNMKEALIYDMYQYFGADASLYNYAKIYVNGEYWGVYLALEAVEDSFLLRNYGTENGALYKPDSMNIGGDLGDMTLPSQGDSGQFDFSQFENLFDTSALSRSAQEEDNAQGGQGTPPDLEDFDLEDFDFGFSGDGGGGIFSMGGGGANLNYIDDDLDSYSTIWEGEVTDTTKSDHKRVVAALKNISEGTDLEESMDIDNLLRYMAVHVFSVNDDSLTGMMAHNYYLYESDGQLNIIPWDYNLALGGMGGMGGMTSGVDTATSVVNDAIDQAFSGTEFFDTLMEQEEYHQAYYEYLDRLMEEYIFGGGFDEFYTRTRSQIDALVESDPNAFYTYEEYLTAVETLYEVVQLRGESIRGQLDGTIPSVESEQRDSDALIDASHLDLSVMGSMSMGDSLWDFGSDSEEDGSDATGTGSPSAVSAQGADDGASIQLLASSGQDGSGFDPSQFGGGELPEGFDPSQFGDGKLPEGFDPSQFGEGELPDGFDPSQSGSQSPDDAETDPAPAPSDGADQDSAAPESQAPSGGTSPGNFGGGGGGMGDMPDFSFGGGSSTGDSSSGNLILYAICFGVLLAALVFAKLYRRRPRKR